jgi:hypothetical protein
MSLTLATIAIGVKRLQGSHKRVKVECDLLQDQFILDLEEGRERRVVRDDGSKMIVPLVQPSKNVEDKIAIGDHTNEIVKGVNHAHHLATLVTHREVTLDEVAEHGIKVKHTHLAIADELVLEHEPDLAHANTALLGDVL